MKAKILMLLFHICFLPKMLYAQEEKPNWWIQNSYGISTIGRNYTIGGLAASVGYFRQPKQFAWGINSNFQIPIEIFGDHGEKVFAIDGLAGVCTDKKIFNAGIFSGLSLITGTLQGKNLGSKCWLCGDTYEKVSFITMGIPVNAFISLRGKYFSRIILNTGANLNYKKPSAYILLGGQIGRFRGK